MSKLDLIRLVSFASAEDIASAVMLFKWQSVLHFEVAMPHEFANPGATRDNIR